MSPARLPLHLPRRIHELPERWARDTPDSIAIIDHDGNQFTWVAFEKAIHAAADLLEQRDVRGGDRVLIVAENAMASAALLFACSRLDAWAVILNARLTETEIDRIIDHCTPRCAVFTHLVSPDAGRHGERIGAETVDGTPLGPVMITRTLDTAPEPVASGNDGQVAVMIYTSGTTGAPKGVMLTHRNVLYIATVSGAVRGLESDDIVYAVLPISHVFGLSSTCLGTINAGGTLITVPRFDPVHLANALGDGVTVFQGVPAMYARLLEHLDTTGQDLVAPDLRYMSAGGAPLDIHWKRRIEARFGLTLNNGYGLTEASPTVCQTLIANPRDDDSIGPPIPGTEVRFIGADGMDVAKGEVGELLVRGPNIMKGYFRDANETAATITPDGWLKTGDLGCQNPDGACFIVGRAKELIIRSGFNVYPPEIETALNAHDDVVLSAVIGRPVDGDEQIVAFVETIPGSSLTEAALAEFAGRSLAPYKRPQHLFIVQALPVNTTNKVLKHSLRGVAEAMIMQRTQRKTRDDHST